MEIQTVRTPQDFLALEPEWQRLWQQQQNRQVFQHHAWSRAFIEAFCGSRRWLVLVAREAGEAVALLPLWEDIKPGHWRLLGSPSSDYHFLLGDEQAVIELIARLPRDGVRVLRFEAMPEGQKLWLSLGKRNLAVVKEGDPLPCWHVALSEATTVALRRKKGMRDNIRRLSKSGPLRLRVIGQGHERSHHLELLFEQHRRRWNNTAKPSQFNDPATCDFYRRLCSAPALSPILHFSVLEAGNQVLACHLGFVQQGTFIYYKPAYDPHHKGAGKVLMSKLMDEAFLLGLSEFDFTRGDEPYKAQLATGARFNHEARLFFSTPDKLLFQGGQWLRRRVPRDADGLALPTKWLRRIKSMLRGR